MNTSWFQAMMDDPEWHERAVAAIVEAVREIIAKDKIKESLKYCED